MAGSLFAGTEEAPGETIIYEGRKFNAHSVEHILDSLTIEEALQININDKPFTVSMRTPGEDVSLVRGMLHSEGILKNTSFIPDVVIKKENEPQSIIKMHVPRPRPSKKGAGSKRQKPHWRDRLRG